MEDKQSRVSTSGSPVPFDEEGRISRLNTYDILNADPDEKFDRVTALAARLLDAPIALLSLVDRERLWFKSRIGVPVAHIPRHKSFCAHAICSDEPLIVEDTLKDRRFADHPLVTGEAKIRFYAGSQICSFDGYNLGTLCILGTRPRSFSAREKQVLAELSEVISDELDSHLNAARASTSEQRLYDAVSAMPDAFALFDANEKLVHFNRRFTQAFGGSTNSVRTGQTYSAILRTGIENDLFPEARGREVAWINLRLEQFRNSGVPKILNFKGGKWRRISVDKTREGGRVMTCVDVTDAKLREASLETMAWSDAVTGLLRRNGFIQLAASECKRAQRMNTHVGVLILQFQDFVQVKDRVGLDLANKVLEYVSQQWLNVLRGYDTAARIDDNQVAILLPDATSEIARIVADRLLSASRNGVIRCGDVELTLKISIGSAERQDGELNIEPALERAEIDLRSKDMAMGTQQEVPNRRSSDKQIQPVARIRQESS